MKWTSAAIDAVKRMVATIAGALIPGWELEFVFAESMAETGGALAYCIPQPRREKAKIVIAPHPPDESLRETIAHELGHAWVSPLVELIEPSEAASTIEEVLIERFSKFAAAHPGLVGALARVTKNPRTTHPIVRKRISALASRRRNEGKNKMADGSRLAELAMKAGEMGAREDVPEDVRALLAEFVAELAGGSGPPSNAAPPMREDGDPAKSDAPAMREDEMPPAMREQYRRARMSTASMLKDTIRLRLHTARTVDGIVLDAETEKDLGSCTSIEDFERVFRLVTRQAAKGSEQQRKRSGVNPDVSDINGAPSIEAMIAEGIPQPVAENVRRAFGQGKDHGQTALDTARKYRKAVPNG